MVTLTKQKSSDVRKLALDQRAIRTGQQIDAAFVELLHRRVYEDIRVSDIAKKARVGRATYYAHYASKDALLRSQFRRIVAPMLTEGSGGCAIDCTNLFTHVTSAPRLFKALFGGGGRGATVLRECFEERMNELLPARSGVPAAIPQKMIARFVAASLVSIVECWVESGLSKSPAELQTIFHTLAGAGLMSRAT